ncbi:hypothetical protein GM160_11230 [Guyparkeria halophila]|uniref:Uncharacterized protein n=1 Tax=Guyparkeria halophila TaxID=47960 RepID=A0A6I6DC80_9GAMM|nr:hypothetical protein [Guyparkeria halophila]QGT79402.1 hypothetical protein GM160_11230 [Guyparkeria halophila]
MARHNNVVLKMKTVIGRDQVYHFSIMLPAFAFSMASFAPIWMVGVSPTSVAVGVLLSPLSVLFAFLTWKLFLIRNKVIELSDEGILVEGRKDIFYRWDEIRDFTFTRRWVGVLLKDREERVGFWRSLARGLAGGGEPLADLWLYEGKPDDIKAILRAALRDKMDL